MLSAKPVPSSSPNKGIYYGAQFGPAVSAAIGVDYREQLAQYIQYMDDDFYQRQANLQNVLDEIERLRCELIDSQLETDNLELEVETLRLQERLSDLGYAIYQERLRRARAEINGCLDRLDTQRLRALWRLFELESE